MENVLYIIEIKIINPFNLLLTRLLSTIEYKVSEELQDLQYLFIST